MLIIKYHKLVVSVSLVFCFNVAQASVAESSEKMALTQLLYSFNLGNNSFYNKVLSPAKSLNTNLNDSGRIQEVNDKIIFEMDKVISAFNIVGEDRKVEAVKQVINKIDPEINKNGGAYIQFVNGKPSAAFSRVILFIQKKAGNKNVTAAQFLKSFSSYKRSAIPSTTIYEYSDAKNLNQSNIKTSEGNDNSWKTPLAAADIPSDQDLVLKKCRQILGWKCVTSLYHTGQVLQNNENIKYLFAAIHDLTNNPDHPDFAKDKRSVNQITGSTALYSIKESANWIMIYGVDAQWNNDKLSFTSLIQDEFQKDYKRVKERLMIDLKISQEDFK
ncbi:hypothetical protein K2P97_02175 [bacterium]|nr:hypothetical protein [bacterium]